MKKFSICLSILGLLSIASNIFSAENIIKQQLEPAIKNFGTGSTPTQQNQTFDEWGKAFSDAGVFAINNSKNLVGVKDSDIVATLKVLNDANHFIINTIKTVRGISSIAQLNEQKSLLKNKQDAIVNQTNKLNRATMTLNNKKEAKSLVLALGRYLEMIIQKADTLIQQKINNLPKPALPPRGTNIPAPSTRTVAKPEAVEGECIICREPAGKVEEPCPTPSNPNKMCTRLVTLVKIPCKNNHSDPICTDDLKELRATTNICPLCRQPLLK